MAMVLGSQEAHASSSSSSLITSHPCYSYDVFLSFRGEDTRKSFTDHLYAALKQAGIRTFRDDDEMERGKQLEPELKKAICESAISIIVFSTNYASSKWCLDEVLTIIEENERLSSKHEVVPVFYNIEPSDVRNQTGSFEKAFSRYEGIIEAESDPQKKIQWSEKVNAWRASLRKAGSLTGMVLANGHEAKFIRQIVRVVRKKLGYKLLYIEDKLVGIKENVAEIELWLQDPSPDAVFLVIHGMGGIGKTTISKCIYNSNSHEYDVSCFLADIGETSSHYNGLIRLQSQLLSTIFRSEKEELIWTLDEGTSKIRDAICSKKILLILDNVTTRQQLTALLGPQQLYPGSKVIITTRHQWLLDVFKICPKLHSIKELDHNESIELFCLYAFHEDKPIKPYVVESELIVRHCRGLPLALKVLGSSLYGKNIDVWKDEMRKLEAIPNPEIQKILKLSYESIEDSNDKDVFLHIACFFVGEDKEYIVKLLAQCDLYPVVGIKNLMDRCLLYIEKGNVMMHQLIKEMGHEIVRQQSPKDPGKRSRLWRHEDSFNVLKDNEGTRKVEGLILDMRMIKEADNARKRSYGDFLHNTKHINIENLKIGALEKMKNLMLLQLDYVTFSGSYKKLPKKLRWLRWHGFSLKSIPCDVPLEKLVVLDMRYSKLKTLWDGFKVIGSLKVLNLGYSLELAKTPDFRGLPSLESLILEGCISLTQVCESIGYLEKLYLLDISDCIRLRDIKCFPMSLVSLKMSNCPNLGVLGQVQCLDTSSLPSLLVNIDVSKCNLFDNSFPNDWSHLLALKSLNISRNNISSLPNCIKSLPSLEILECSNCSQLQSVLGVPKSVKELDASENMSLEKVQTAPNLLTYFNTQKSANLCAVEGCFKHELVQKVEKKLLRYLGIESISEAMNSDLGNKQMVSTAKVLYEFGIFSTYFLGKTLPCLKYREIGSKISFRVPSHPEGSRINGLNVCYTSTALFEDSVIWDVEVNNKTKLVVWKYTPTMHVKYENLREFCYVWLSLWRCGDLLDEGDEVVVCITLSGGDRVKECGINFVYEDLEDKDEEKKDAHAEDLEDKDEEKKDAHCMFSQISWTDRLLVEISDYVHRGKTYCFKVGGFSDVPNIGGISDLIVDWWGLRANWRSRSINVSQGSANASSVPSAI